MKNKAFKFKLKPTKAQERVLVQWLGSCRFIWNHMLELNKTRYEEEKKFNFKYDMSAMLPKKKKEFEFLKDVPSHALLNKVFDLDTALKRVWRQGNGFPKFKSRHYDQTGICINQVNGHIHITKNQIKIPKIGWVTWNKHRPIEGNLKNITIKQELNKWYVVCLCEIQEAEPKQVIDSIVGIDLGLKEFAVTSDGEVFETQKLYRKKQKKLARQQRIMARRKKGSANRLKAKNKLAKTHQKIRHQRMDFTHKISTRITKEYRFVAIEDLNIKGMTKNRKLAKAISDQGWAMFLGQLDYKSRNNGGRTVKIDRFAPSTKTCSNCGTKHNMPLAVRVMRCGCGFEMDRDANAAINIRRWGLEKLVGMGHTKPGEKSPNACGDTTIGDQAYDWSRYVSLKQEQIEPLGSEAATLQGSQ